MGAHHDLSVYFVAQGDTVIADRDHMHRIVLPHFTRQTQAKRDLPTLIGEA
jgi:hypothetical protein